MKTLPFVFLLIAVSAAGAYAGVSTVTPAEGKVLVRHLIPLPHEIRIEKKAVVSPGDVRITVRPGATEIERNAAAELSALFRERTGKEPSGNGFEIRIGVNDPRMGARLAARLKSLPNHEQAYAVIPDGSGRIVLTGLDGRGVYYAARTLHQLLEATLTRDTAAIPLAEITDWPDLDERGLWNFGQPEIWIPWMASLKLNYAKMVNTNLQNIERGKPNHAAIDRDLMLKARLQAFNYLPFILHLNFLHDYGLYSAYPEVAGKGDGALAGRYFAHKGGSFHRAPCASNPMLANILAEWMADIASQGADEVSCWLTERPAQCGCPECLAVGQFVAETRAFLAAWREVKKTRPGFMIRIFISTTDNDRYNKVLAELPPEVKIERACHAGLDRVVREPRDLIRSPLFDSYADEGRWISSYDAPVSANGLVETPEFKVPQSSPHRMRAFVRHMAERKWRGVYGMLPWGNMGREVCGFSINALAEWSWNLEGRSEREFAAAWAVREGMKDPDAAGEWAEIMGPVEFDVYDSDFPTCWSWGKAVDMVKNRRQPVLGEGMFRYYPDAGDFDRKLAACDRARAIAEKAGYTRLALESRVVRSYIDLAKQVYRIAQTVSTRDVASPDVQKELALMLPEIRKAGAENAAAIRAWRTELGPEPWHPRVHDAIAAAGATAQGIADHVTNAWLY